MAIDSVTKFSRGVVFTVLCVISTASKQVSQRKLELHIILQRCRQRWMLDICYFCCVRRSGVFIANLEHIPHFVLVFLLLSLNM